jgi:hypothetical protein
MAIAAQTQPIADCINCTSYTFYFKKTDLPTLDGYLIGLSGFSLSYASGEDHDIKNLQIMLKDGGTGFDTGSNSWSITVQWTVTMDDNWGGNSAQSGTLDITVLAFSGDPSTLRLLAYNQVPHDTFQDAAPAILTTGLYQAQSVLRGFNLSFGNTDQRVSSIGFGVSCSTATQTLMAGCTGVMTYDWNDAASANVDVGVIACFDEALAGYLGLGASPLRLTETFVSNPDKVNPVPQYVTKTHSNYAYFMSGYYVRYNSASKHYVQTVSASISVSPNPNDSTQLEVTGTAIMHDKGNSPDHQNVKASYVDTVVIQWDNPS